jgi:hypothetical protein
MRYRPSNLLVWFGVGGGAVAFALQFVAGLAFSFAQCNNGSRWHVPVSAWQVGFAAGGFAIGVASTAVAATIFRRTYRLFDIFGQERRGDGSAPPLGRIHFLSIVGLTVNVLVLTIMLMDAIGTGLHGMCVQS